MERELLINAYCSLHIGNRYSNFYARVFPTIVDTLAVQVMSVEVLLGLRLKKTS